MTSDLNGDGREPPHFSQGASSPPLEMEAPLGSGSNVAVNPEAVNKVLYSEIGLHVLLNRLKQSVASAREFAAFLNKRARLGEKHAQGLKEMGRATAEAVRRPDCRQGSYAIQVADIARAHDRMGDHGIQFANSLTQMHTDLNELIANMERSRKHWKQETTTNEKKVKDAEGVLEKAKSRYDSLAEDYDRARTGGQSSGRVFTVKGPKSAEKHEEDLHRKLQMADTEYASKVQTAQSLRQENLNQSRPQAVKALQELIRECDSALTLQLQKFATFNEKLLVGNGLEVSPVKSPSGEATTGQISMREMALRVDNDRDFQSFMTSHTASVPMTPPEIKYQKHPLLAPTQQTPQAPMSRAAPPEWQPTQSSQPPPPPQVGPQPTASFAGSQPAPQPLQPVSPQAPSSPPSQSTQLSPGGSPYGPAAGRPGPPPKSAFRGPPPQQYGSPNGGGAAAYPPPSGPPYGQQPPGSAGSASRTNGSPVSQGLPPIKPVFGLSLEQLFERDDMAVPMVVLQCIQAVDLFGLDVEGIYRLNGNAQHINQLRAAFDNDWSRVDFRNPENFFHDVNSVAGLLKQFFRDLPDPLFTKEHYNHFIDAARIDDDIIRRDSIHGVINALPDPNYATIRALVLHLTRVQEHAQSNRMSTQNLAICFAPSVMGQHTGPQMADAGLQARVIDTILTNTFQIFDDD